MKRTNLNLDKRIGELQNLVVEFGWENKFLAQLKIAIVVSQFNLSITEQLVFGALSVLEKLGVPEKAVKVVRVPGSFEIPLAAQKLAHKGEFESIICLGCVIQGETPHFDYICRQVSRGVGEVGLKYDLPVMFGVITANTFEQAVNRADLNSGNKGAEAALSAVEMAILMKRLAEEG